MRKRGLAIAQQRSIIVMYDDVVVGDYAAGLLVEDDVIIELKVARALNDQHIAQCMNDLRATNKRLCLLINFGCPRIEIRRLAARP
jgi:GxxExxY protein